MNKNVNLNVMSMEVIQYVLDSVVKSFENNMTSMELIIPCIEGNVKVSNIECNSSGFITGDASDNFRFTVGHKGKLYSSTLGIFIKYDKEVVNS